MNSIGLEKQDLIFQRHDFLKHYQIISELGEGGFGSVKKCQNIQTGKYFAVKIIPKHRIANIKFFLEEINILSRADHQNILKLFEWYEDKAKFYIVTELYTGGELYDKLSSKGTFSEKDAVDIVIQIIQAVNYLHSIKIVHRDIKPENLVYASQNENVIKLIDFGTSKYYKNEGKDSIFTTLKGSSYYMSPEMFEKHYTNKCDIWSIGVVTYMLLSGYPPFNGISDQEIYKAIKQASYNFSSPEWNIISDKGKQFISRIFVKEEMRPSAEELLGDPWLTKTNINHAIIPLNRLVMFNNSQYLKRLILHTIAYQAAAKEIEPLIKIFNDLDINKDGKLSKKEFVKGFDKNLAINIIYKIFGEIDQDHDGFIEFNDFLASTIDEKMTGNKEKIKEAFYHFDLNNSGKIEVKKLEEILKNTCKDNPNKFEKLKILISIADVNKDGFIDFLEFSNIINQQIIPQNKIIKIKLASPKKSFSQVLN